MNTDCVIRAINNFPPAFFIGRTKKLIVSFNTYFIFYFRHNYTRIKSKMIIPFFTVTIGDDNHSRLKFIEYFIKLLHDKPPLHGQVGYLVQKP